MSTGLVEIIAIANLKGGVGKSTIAVNLACALLGQNRTAVVIDADSQGTSSFWGRHGALPVGLRAMPLEDETVKGGLIARLTGRAATNKSPRREAWVSEVRQIKDDYVVIDCPPHVGAATRAAVEVADLVLVPVTASAADLAATAQALNLLAQVRAGRADKGPKCLLVPSRVDRTTATGKTIEALLEHLGEPVGPVICQRTSFADAVAFGQWVGDFAPKSEALEEITNLAYSVRRILGQKERRGRRLFGERSKSGATP